MRALATILTVAYLTPSVSTAQTADSTSIEIHFHIPKGWGKLNDSTFVLRNYDREFNYWAQYLADGHMPWRLGPANVAATCLWDFGIKDPDHMLVWEFVSELKDVKKGEVYSLPVRSKEYVLFVRSKLYQSRFTDGQGRERTDDYLIPIPYRLETRHERKNGG
jgi:hypothetical protein